MRSYIDASRLDDYVLVQRVRDMTARLGAEVFCARAHWNAVMAMMCWLVIAIRC